ncbi:energy-coupling factor transporter ATPase [Pseudoscardovia suis]|uniref:Cobalt ABC transporter n=1 Tax=Pseudoscardovia suis TaxID=987063 RepID=A0A261F1C2_9BIFI|nr:energy-coupling factor transporter ATPase [Pseudoscardovia suis]OZG52920.1 cobalt ABC transporter [Pseudoscardovia suis]PJJ68425.1 energy-coupling factor transport system ATP-binding protein [Pseudoscardovia suis]
MTTSEANAATLPLPNAPTVSATTSTATPSTQPAAQPTAQPTAVACLRNVTFRHGTRTVLDNLDVTIHDGEWVAIMGSNGSGKTTLSRLLSGLTAPDNGSVQLMGLDCFTPVSGVNLDAYRAARRNIGLVQQNPEDQIVTTVVEDDVAFGPENQGLPAHTISERVHDALARTGMEGEALSDPDDLSGGQQQRVAIAGTLALHPRMLVLDEPTAMLDPQGRAETLRTMKMAHDHGTTIVQVTHIASEARLASRVIELDNGSIIYDGPAEGCNLCKPAAAQVSVPPSDAAPASKQSTDTTPGLPAGPSAQPAMPSTSASCDDSSCDDASQRGIVFAVKNVSFRYPNADAFTLRNIDFTVTQGEFVTITGSNGSGKSTLLSLLSGINKPTQGTVRAWGCDPHSRKGKRQLLGRIGYVMQMPERQLFETTVAQDVAFGPTNLGLNSVSVNQRVHDTLETVGISKLADRSPWELSGGQKRLAAIAGVLSMDPDVLLLDEPTAGLDARACHRIIGLLDGLHRRGVTIVVVTHDPDRFRTVATRTFHLDTASSGSAGNISDTDLSQTNVQSEHKQHKQQQHGKRRRNAHRLVSRMDTRVLEIVCTIMMAGMFTVTSPLQLAWAFIGVLTAMCLTDAGARRIMASCKSLFAIILVLGLFNVFFVRTGSAICHIGTIPITDEGLRNAVLYSLRFALVIVIGATAVSAASTTRLTDATESLLSPLARIGVPIHECALIMTLAIRFLPIISREFTQLAHAQASRGGNISTGSPSKRLKAAVSLLVPVFALALRHAEHMGTAMESRGYESGIVRTHWHQSHPGAADLCACIGVALWLAGLIAIPQLW